MLRVDNMKVLTLGVSPFYFTRNAKIHDSIIRNLSIESDGSLNLSSVFLEHDIEYFPQESIQSRYKGIEGKFYSTSFEGDQLVTSVFDIIEAESPEVVLSIGAFSDFEYIRAIKRVLPSSFNWVIILTSNIDDRFSEFSETLKEADHVICLTDQSFSALKKQGINCSLFEFGVDDIYMSDSDTDKSNLEVPTFLVNDKNLQQSNLALVLDTFTNFVDNDFKLILHTNYYEPGDYDLDYLTSKFRAGQVEIPGDFVGIREGISQDELLKKYSNSHYVIDLSIKPITSLCVLEGMSQGCVPIINRSGCLYEKLIGGEGGEREYSDFSDLYVDNNLFFGEYLEPFYIISQDSFFEKLSYSFRMINENIGEYKCMSELSRSMSIQFSSKGFCQKVSNFIISNRNIYTKKELKLKVETF